MPETTPQHSRSISDDSDPFVFVSYSHSDQDRRVVLAEIDALRERGYRVSYDDGIHPGARWHDEIATAIAKCSLLLFFVTPRSAGSAMCQREIKFALGRHKPVVAVHLEETRLPDGIEFAIGDLQAIFRTQLSEDQYRSRLNNAVATFLERAPSIESTHVGRSSAFRVPNPALRWSVAAALLLALSIGAFLVHRAWRQATEERAQRGIVLGEVRSLVERDDYGAAFARLRPLVIAEGSAVDADVGALWQKIVSPMKPIIADAGATVSFKPYAAPDIDWIPVGTAPIEHWVDAPKGVLKVRIEKSGFGSRDFAIANPGPSVETTDAGALGLETLFHVHPVPLELSKNGTMTDGFVRVPATTAGASIVGWNLGFGGDEVRPLPAFAIGRAEVTNEEFRAFVDAHGYDNPIYWEGLHFVDGGHELTWERARKRFVDRTDRPGPATWDLGNYPTGQADFPVGGISWYEAAAYARFRGAALPTIHHWSRAAFGPFDGLFGVLRSVAPSSRMSADAPVAEQPGVGLGPWGTVNTAGNVREWVWNFAGSYALAMGGSWSDPPEMAATTFPTSPFDRSPQNGVRLMQGVDNVAIAPDLLAPIELAVDPAAHQAPVSDQAFEAMRFQFIAVHRVPTRVTKQTVEENDIWVADEVTLEFGDERFVLFLVEPRHAKVPMQPVIYAPSQSAFLMPNANREVLVAELRTVDFVVRSGRALVIPIWAGSYERFQALPADADALADVQRTAPARWYADLITTLDYLETQPDFDAQRVGIIGFSTGARLLVEPLIAIEGRLKAAVLLSGGVQLGVHPMMDAINYASRTFQPILMINGRYDNVVPIAQAQRSYFDLLGTAAKDKRHVVFDCGHIDFPPNLEAKEVADWFDRYLGPVR